MELRRGSGRGNPLERKEVGSQPEVTLQEDVGGIAPWPHHGLSPSSPLLGSLGG